jgi:hypothetical protein
MSSPDTTIHPFSRAAIKSKVQVGADSIDEKAMVPVSRLVSQATNEKPLHLQRIIEFSEAALR